MARDELNLDLERRRALLELVTEYPGLHLSEIARRPSWSPMLAEYHLRALERHEFVSSLQDDHYRRYYPREEREGLRVDTLGASDKRLLALLRHPVRLHILAYLAHHGSGRNRDLARELGLSRPATSYQLGKLTRVGAVARDEAGLYTLVEPARVRRMLLTYRPPSDAVERFRSLWDQLSRPSEGPERFP